MWMREGRLPGSGISRPQCLLKPHGLSGLVARSSLVAVAEAEPEKSAQSYCLHRLPASRIASTLGQLRTSSCEVSKNAGGLSN